MTWLGGGVFAGGVFGGGLWQSQRRQGEAAGIDLLAAYPSPAVLMYDAQAYTIDRSNDIHMANVDGLVTTPTAIPVALGGGDYGAWTWAQSNANDRMGYMYGQAYTTTETPGVAEAPPRGAGSRILCLETDPPRFAQGYNYGSVGGDWQANLNLRFGNADLPAAPIPNNFYIQYWMMVPYNDVQRSAQYPRQKHLYFCRGVYPCSGDDYSGLTERGFMTDWTTFDGTRTGNPALGQDYYLTHDPIDANLRIHSSWKWSGRFSQCTTGGTNHIVDTNLAAVAGAYIGALFIDDATGASRRVTAYDHTTHTLTLDSPLSSGFPLPNGGAYTLRYVEYTDPYSHAAGVPGGVDPRFRHALSANLYTGGVDQWDGTDLARPHMEYNRWYCIREHYDFRTAAQSGRAPVNGASQGAYEQWIRTRETDWVKTAEWIGGVTPGFTYSLCGPYDSQPIRVMELTAQTEFAAASAQAYIAAYEAAYEAYYGLAPGSYTYPGDWSYRNGTGAAFDPAVKALIADDFVERRWSYYQDFCIAADMADLPIYAVVT